MAIAENWEVWHIEHIALGSRFDGFGRDIEFVDASMMHLFVRELAKNKFTIDVIEKNIQKRFKNI